MPRTLQLSWSDLIDNLPVEYLIPSQAVIDASAKNKAATWVEIYERREQMQLTPIEHAEIDAVFVQLLTAHWALPNVVRNNLSLSYFSGLLNHWGLNVLSSGASERLLPRGYAVTCVTTSDYDFVTFDLQPPFLRARVEALHRARGITDDGLSFQDVTPAHLFDTIHAIFEAEGLQPVVVDLRHWDAALALPRYEELEARVQALRLQRQKLEGETDAPTTQ